MEQTHSSPILEGRGDSPKVACATCHNSIWLEIAPEYPSDPPRLQPWCRLMKTLIDKEIWTCDGQVYAARAAAAQQKEGEE